MNDLDAQRSAPQPRQEAREEDRKVAPRPPSGLEWLVRQAQRQRHPR
ncbi:hypothetical protein JOF41_005629 [Saccharothrix coeruleofusca]|nr:hypothetical protein [Saccharothrix coeruleofusca]MBP2339451.1 hypothetical protein [Saccharothrix coeruleofusca]